MYPNADIKRLVRAFQELPMPHMPQHLWKVLLKHKPVFKKIDLYLPRQHLKFDDIEEWLETIIRAKITFSRDDTGKPIRLEKSIESAYDSLDALRIFRKKNPPLYPHGSVIFPEGGHLCQLCWRLAPENTKTGYGAKIRNKTYFSQHLCSFHSAALARKAVLHDAELLEDKANIETDVADAMRQADRERRAAERIIVAATASRRELKFDTLLFEQVLKNYRTNMKEPWIQFLKRTCPSAVAAFPAILKGPREALAALDDDSFPEQRRVLHNGILEDPKETVSTLEAMLLQCEAILKIQSERKRGGARPGAGRPVKFVARNAKLSRKIK